MPTPFSLMSGNFDNPPASESPEEIADRVVRGILDNDQSAADISPSGELYRAIERFHRTRRAAAARLQSTADQMASGQDHNSLERRRRREAASALDESPPFILPPGSSLEPSRLPSAGLNHRDRAAARVASLNARRGRARGPDYERFVERYRTANGDNASNGLADLQHAGRQLEAASSNLRALLDEPVPDLSSPLLEPEESEYSHRTKRRRLQLDGSDSKPRFTGFRYGKYGQVEPGKLEMEIVSCDGGIFLEKGHNYSAENVLKNDRSVYCTKSNRCNLVLRHQGSTVFSLKELIITAPHSGYTAPIQEGMVFISMTSDDLLTRTAQYQIQYSPARTRCSRDSPSPELPPITSHRSGHGTLTPAQASARRLYMIGRQDEECDFRTAQIPSDFTVNAPFHVTTECSDSEYAGDELNSHSRALHDIHRLTGIRVDEEESSENEDHQHSAWDDDFLPDPSVDRRRERASNITLAEAVEASQIATQEAVRAVGGELMTPHAKFFIERDKSRCTVRFDPPVSGRFILLKMWSPHHSPSANIDIQSVVVNGFAGPRVFPALHLR